MHLCFDDDMFHFLVLLNTRVLQWGNDVDTLPRDRTSSGVTFFLKLVGSLFVVAESIDLH
jgi:hypothetical protein